VTHGLIVALAALGVVGLVLRRRSCFSPACSGSPAAACRCALLRRWIWGYELWLAFLAAAMATGGSLFFSEVAHFVPCELCWFQRICMYPLSITTLLMALADDHRAARYLLPLPLVGAGVSTYHLLVENASSSRRRRACSPRPAICATKWINEFGFVTIPTLALTAFVLVFAACCSACSSPGRRKRKRNRRRRRYLDADA